MIQVSPTVVRWVVTGIVAGALVWSLTAGYIAGRDLARAEATVIRAQVLKQSLALFHEDQSRFPSELEYASSERLGVYVRNFPGPQFTHKKWCLEEPRYLSRGGRSFEYTYCLPRGFGGLARGWHMMDERSIDLP